ncbi:CMRF35-like molecule 2 [Mustelus asterias]
MDFSFHFLVISFAVVWAASNGPDAVNGTVGQSVHIKCRYDKYYSNYQKYWCKGDDQEDCAIVVQTHGPKKTSTDGRITIVADDEAGEFTVTMEQLTQSDEGLYWCGIERLLWDLQSPVELKINEGPKVLLAISPSDKEIQRQKNYLYYFIWSVLRWIFLAILLLWAILAKLKM